MQFATNIPYSRKYRQKGGGGAAPPLSKKKEIKIFNIFGKYFSL
jgi:hypothetical protein